MEAELDNNNKDIYAELNSIIEKEDQAVSTSGKKGKLNRIRKDKSGKGHKKGIIFTIILCCLLAVVVSFLAITQRKVLSHISLPIQTQGKVETKNSNNSKKKPEVKKKNSKNVSESDTKKKKKKETVSVSDSDTENKNLVSPQSINNPGFSYDKTSKTVKINLCGNVFDFPFLTNALATKGWNGISSNADPDNSSLSVSTWTNVNNSTMYLYFPSAQEGTTYITKAEIAFTDKSDSFLGLSTSISSSTADSLFSDCVSTDFSGFTGGNGKRIYNYDSFSVTASFQNDYITGCSIEKH